MKQVNSALVYFWSRLFLFRLLLKDYFYGGYSFFSYIFTWLVGTFKIPRPGNALEMELRDRDFYQIGNHIHQEEILEYIHLRRPSNNIGEMSKLASLLELLHNVRFCKFPDFQIQNKVVPIMRTCLNKIENYV